MTVFDGTSSGFLPGSELLSQRWRPAAHGSVDIDSYDRDTIAHGCCDVSLHCAYVDRMLSRRSVAPPCGCFVMQSFHVAWQDRRLTYRSLRIDVVAVGKLLIRIQWFCNEYL